LVSVHRNAPLDVALGRNLGWTGVALETCKTVTGSLLSLCRAKQFSFTLMAQDLTNPMLAQIPPPRPPRWPRARTLRFMCQCFHRRGD
jgi:hypothetical protein